jgi:hypothetical protein
LIDFDFDFLRESYFFELLNFYGKASYCIVDWFINFNMEVLGVEFGYLILIR